MPFIPSMFCLKYPDLGHLTPFVTDLHFAYGPLPPNQASTNPQTRANYEKLCEGAFAKCWNICFDGTKKSANLNALKMAYCLAVALYAMQGLLPEPATGISQRGKQPHAYDAVKRTNVMGGVDARREFSWRSHANFLSTRAWSIRIRARRLAEPTFFVADVDHPSSLRECRQVALNGLLLPQSIQSGLRSFLWT